jgi:hypothetical protein
MTKEEYKEQLRDNRWSVKRKKILARDKCKCQECSSRYCLEVHHLYYVTDKKAWEYPNDVLVTWCNDCHSKWHEEHEIIVRSRVFSEGKKKKFKPPVKVKKTRKRKKPVVNKTKNINRFTQIQEFQKLKINQEDRRKIWRVIKNMSILNTQKYLSSIQINIVA